MSNIKKGQTCPLINIDSFDGLDNKTFTRIIMQEFKARKGRNAVKHMAQDLNLNPDTIKNWLYKNNGMNAVQLFMIMKKYDFIKEIVTKNIK